MAGLNTILKCAEGEGNIPGVAEAREINAAIAAQYASLRETPYDERPFSIGMIIDCVGNVDEANELTDEQIFDAVKVLNYEMDQQDPTIATLTPPSYAVKNATSTGLNFYIKEINRNYVLPSGTWHSMTDNVNTAYFGEGNDLTMLKGDVGGKDPDRFTQYINVVICNFSGDGTNPRTFTTNFNIGASGFSWKPRDIINNPFLSESEIAFRQRIVLHSAFVGGKDVPPNIIQWAAEEGRTWNDPYFGSVFAHEMGHYLDLAHTWGATPWSTWNDPDYHNCDSDRMVADVKIQDGPCRITWSPTYGDQLTPPEEITRPNEFRDECFYDGATDPENIPYTNVMNYCSDSLSVSFTADQRTRMRRCFVTPAYEDYRPPLAETTAPINFNNTTSVIQNMYVDGASATRAYMGSQKVWDISDVPDPGPPPDPTPSLQLSNTFFQRAPSNGGCTRGTRYDLRFAGIHNIDDPGREFTCQYWNTLNSGWFPLDPDTYWTLDTYTQSGVSFELRCFWIYVCTPSGTPSRVQGRMRYRLSDGTLTEWVESPPAFYDVDDEEPEVFIDDPPNESEIEDG